MIQNPEQTIWDRVRSAFPAPIAIAARSARRSFTKKEEHDRLLDLLEISAMTIATALASQYRADNGENAQADEVLARMANASFGTWVDAITVLQPYCSDQTGSSLARSLARELGRKAPFPAQKGAIVQIARLIMQEQNNLPGKFSVLTFLQSAVTYRNEIAHAKPAPSEEVCRVRLAWLGPAVEEFLEAIGFLQRYPLVYAQRLVIQQKRVVCEANSCIGWDLDRFPHQRTAKIEIVVGNLYLCAAEDESPTLKLLPAILYGLCSGCAHDPRVFVLRKANVKPERGIAESCSSVEYTCPVCGNRVRVDDSKITAAFLDLLRPTPKTIRQEVKQPTETEESPLTPEPAQPEASAVPSSPKPGLRVPQRMINPNLSLFLTLYSQSVESNQRTRGLDEFGRRTYIETLLDKQLKPKILSGAVKLVILTGNAGDGKTAFIQQVEAEAKRMGAKDFRETQYGSTFTLKERLYQTIYDGSEDEATKPNQQRLEGFFADFKGARPPEANVTKLIAINEGHLRKVLLYNEDYAWLGRQVHHFLEYDDFRLDPPILIINLNLRSIVDSDLKSTNSIFDRVLGRFLADEFWQECETCVAAERCPVKFNVDSLSDSEYGAQVRQRLKGLYLTTHFRRKQHITVRDLRSSLAYILFNCFSCERIHSELESGQAPDCFETRFYYNAAFGALPTGEDETESKELDRRDRVIRLLREMDVAPVANPKLDNLLNFNPPSAIGLLGAFKKRAPADLAGLEALYKGIREGITDPSEAYYRKDVGRYHAAMRRKYFFECVESALSETGYPSWDKLMPIRSLRKFSQALSDPQELTQVRDELIVAIDLSERIYNETVTTDYLCIRTNPSQGALVKAFNQFPKDDFVCDVQDIGSQSAFLEYCPNVLRLAYRKDKSRSLEISLDLFELLQKVRNGYVPSGSELKGFFLNLLMFKKQLTALPAQAIILTEDELQFYRLEKTGAKTLAIRKV